MNSWQFEGSRAKYLAGQDSKVSCGLSLDPAKPAEFAKISVDSTDWDIASLAAGEQAQEIEELYERESDLIVRYKQRQGQEFSLHLTWRVLPTVNTRWFFAVELWTSIQTRLLDTMPIVIAKSSTIEGASFQSMTLGDLLNQEEAAIHGAGNIGCVSTRSNNYAGFWMIDPSDTRHTDWSSNIDDGCRLFGHFMEKGVIRRGRMRFYVGPSDITNELVAETYAEFAASPLPLTA